MSRDRYDEFASWLDTALSLPIPPSVRAYSFNLYEHEDSYQLQVSGADNFEITAGVWSGDPIFFTDTEYLFGLEKREGDDDWQRGLQEALALIESYLSRGRRKDLLTGSLGVGCGFVDGDAHIVWPNA